MNILYVSVHQILEYDEIRMLQGLGHTVFPLGTYFGFEPVESFRPALEFKEKERQLMEVFLSSGCKYYYGIPLSDQVLVADFIDKFDVILVMHNIDFIDKHWSIISRRQVVWRTIGVNIEAEEERILPFRSRGCKIVRYSPMEMLANRYAGHDAIIRFGKSPDDFARWEGETNQVLIFSNQIKERFPIEYGPVEETLREFPNKICGINNENVPNSVGVVSYETQIELLKSSRVYLYGVGTFITYTLNFMEAWMSGIPLVVLSGRSVLPSAAFKFAEVPYFIDHGKNGFLVSSANEAKEIISMLRSDKAMASRVGESGRAAAISIFGASKIARLWDEFLLTLSD